MSMKLGARNNKSDMARIQAIHDHAQGLGAACEMNDEGKRYKAIKSAAMKFMELQEDAIVAYAIQESWDVQETCQAISILVQLAAGELENAETVDTGKVLDAVDTLYGFLGGEIRELRDAVAAYPAEEYDDSGSKSLSAKADYPWDKCMRDNTKRYGSKETAAKVCGSIRAGKSGNWYPPQNLEAELQRIEQEMGIQPVAEFRGKALSVNYLKSIHIPHAEQFFKDVLAAKFIGKNEIEHAVFVWGNPEQVDLDTDFFTPSKSELGATNFWDRYVGTPRALTWNHAQDKHMLKGNQIIGDTEGYRDSDVARFAQSVLERSHEYRKAIDELIGQRVLGSSSDSAPQYVERVRQKNGSNWIKTWPWFATALTDVPCEYRTIDIGSPYWKAIGVDFKLLQSRIAEAGLETPRGEIANLDQTLTEFQLFDLQQSLAK